MKITILLLIMTFITWDLGWNGHENVPASVESDAVITSEWSETNNVYNWNVYDEQGNIITFIKFFTSK